MEHVQFVMTEDARKEYERRVVIGEQAICAAAGTGVVPEDRETHASDAVADVLTALFGPAGTYGEALWMNNEARERAQEFLDHVMRSWEGDAEDYIVEEVGQ